MVDFVLALVDLPRNLVLPLIAQHRRSIRELILHVGIPTEPGNVEKWQRQWAWNSNDLPERLAELVARYPLPALRLVELWRLDLHAGARQKSLWLNRDVPEREHRPRGAGRRRVLSTPRETPSWTTSVLRNLYGEMLQINGCAMSMSK
ncbi:hypothetical protein ONE63_003587 [Megalurothrips usitatus]|uniref:Uncharacterized protein n=1 Tax=Megalurothrips usitatus TaxID=439358 RepID=A0AAV7X6W6_9NEOP|nr:hypothetical protein ONE63_003587 [Megalurothrips usitatus]